MSIDEYMAGVRNKDWLKKQKLRRRYFVLNKGTGKPVRIVVRWNYQSQGFLATWAVTTLMKNRRTDYYSASDSSGASLGKTPREAVRKIRKEISKAVNPDIQQVEDMVSGKKPNYRAQSSAVVVMGGIDSITAFKHLSDVLKKVPK